MKLKPVLRRVLIELDKVENVSKGGIHIPKEVMESEQRGEYKATVVGIGELAWRDLYQHSGVDFSPPCKVGDRVLFKSFSGAAVSASEDDMIRVINDADIMAVIEEE